MKMIMITFWRKEGTLQQIFFDLQFLVEQIWHGQSALSGIDNRYLLRLCRWVRGQPWTPWNCVLLTEEEAVSHLQLDNMKDVSLYFTKSHYFAYKIDTYRLQPSCGQV